MQNNRTGVIRLIGVFKFSAAWATADITALDSVCSTNKSLF